MLQSARWQLLGPALASALFVALVLTSFELSRRSGQMVTADNVLLYRLLAVSLWSSLALSVVLSVWALVSRSWALLALAAGLSGTFTIFALFSVGPFTLLLTLVQAGAAATMALRLSRPRLVAVLLVAVIVWALLVVLPLMPIWLQWEPA